MVQTRIRDIRTDWQEWLTDGRTEYPVILCSPDFFGDHNKRWKNGVANVHTCTQLPSRFIDVYILVFVCTIVGRCRSCWNKDEYKTLHIDTYWIMKNIFQILINWWKGKPPGSIACTRKQQPRFYSSCSSVVMNNATPLSGTPFSNVNNIHVHSMIPEDEKSMTTQWCSTGRLFTAATQALNASCSK